MKRASLLLACLLFLSAMAAHAQDAGDRPDISTIALAVVMPEIKDLNDNQISIMADRIKNIVSMNGLSAEGGLEGFIIYPKFDIYSVQNVSGVTLKTITVVKCNLSLFVRQFISNAESNIVFSSFNKDIVGSGDNQTEAIANALTQIRPGDDDFQEFLSKTRTRIVNYYEQNCDRIVTEAQHAADLENYDKAFALLLSIPKEATSCYAQVQQRTVEIYLKKQRQECNRTLLEAKTYAASHDYENALATIRKVDPESVCKEDLWALMNDIITRVDDKEKKEWDLMVEQMRNTADLDRARIAAASDLAKAYIDGAGKRNYTVTGNGPNATIQTDPPVPAQNTSYSPSPAPGRAGATTADPSSDLLATTTLQPNVFFENNLFPSFIISRVSYASTDDMKKYGDIYSCIGISVTNPTNDGTLNYEIEPIEDKYFEKVTGTISFVRSQTKQFFPEIPWKFEALKGIEQSTPLSIRFRLLDNNGKSKEQIVKVSIRSIRECVLSFLLDGKIQVSPNLAAYVNEENPQIDKLLKEGIDKNWVSSWDGYQSGAEGLDRQVKAIWKILSSKGIRYSDITGGTTGTSSTFSSQIVRPFCESISNKQANCVDGTLVFASILKRIGIRPVLVLKPGHCFLAYHSTETGSNDYIFLETTMLGDIKGEPTETAFEANYLAAIKTATAESREPDVHFSFIDVEAVRQQKLMPINLSDNCP